jgi:hypothetical protein
MFGLVRDDRAEVLRPKDNFLPGLRVGTTPARTAGRNDPCPDCGPERLLPGLRVGATPPQGCVGTVSPQAPAGPTRGRRRVAIIGTVQLPDAHAVRLLTRDDLRDEGLSDRGIRRAKDAGDIIAVRAGIFVRAQEVTGLSSEGRVVVRARALRAVSRTEPVFTGLTAAALHGLPLYGCDMRPLHIAATPVRSSAGRGVHRHDGAVDDDETAVIGGLRCTSLSRTVSDAARTQPFETAICIADAALRTVAFQSHERYVTERAEELRDAARTIAARFAQGRGLASRVLNFADGHADLPGESVSRIRLLQLGFALPRLQVPVPGPGSTMYWVDLGLEDVESFGEVDGERKYVDALASGMTSAEVLEREKQREDWIRGTTHRRLARWSLRHARTPRALGDRLSQFGIVPPGHAGALRRRSHW